jgi:hypothetical protein
MQTVSISGAWGGHEPREARTEKPRLPYGGNRSGRSDLGGEHTCGPAHEEMTTAAKRAPYGSRYTGMVERRPGPNGGQAAVVGEETGTCPTRAAGGEVHARRDRCAERTSGRSSSPQGLTATGKDLGSEGSPAARRGWRMGAGVRRSEDGRVAPADGVQETTTREVTPCSCQGTLGTWQLQESPDL